MHKCLDCLHFEQLCRRLPIMYKIMHADNPIIQLSLSYNVCVILTCCYGGYGIESVSFTGCQVQVPVPPPRRSKSISSIQRRRGLTDLRADYANVETKTFRFPVNAADDQQLVVLEYCAESRLTYSLPAQLL